MEISDDRQDSIKPMLPTYEKYKRILLLGEADFSFTRAFAKTCNGENNGSVKNDASTEITATEYGDGPDIANRYYDGNQNILSTSMNSLQNLDPVKQILSGFNARRLGDKDCTCQRWNTAKQEWAPPSKFWELSPKFDLIIFNFPHSDQAGRAAKLIKALFRQIRICISDGRLEPTIVIEMRLRHIEVDPKLKKNIRAEYKHEEASLEFEFEMIECWESDLDRWEKLGYQHKWTRRNASIRDVGMGCKVWRWTSKISKCS